MCVEGGVKHTITNGRFKLIAMNETFLRRHDTWLELDGKEEIGGTSKIFSSYMFPFNMTEGLYTYLVLVGVYTSEKSL